MLEFSFADDVLLISVTGVDSISALVRSFPCMVEVVSKRVNIVATLELGPL